MQGAAFMGRKDDSAQRSLRQCLLAVAAACAATVSAQATWSIVVADQRTREVGIGCATCLLSADLQRGLPMMLVERGVAAAQSRIDQGAVNRQRIRTQMLAGVAPEDIIDFLATQDQFHQQRQYGIVDVLGRAATFTGSQAGAYAGGVTGQVGDLVYAIQGNVITGPPVIEMAEAALRDTPGDVPAKLMAAMQAARLMGGDGRCSCSSSDPDGCGAPPPTFERSAHVGCMIIARRGDTDGLCNFTGCALGNYFLDFNIFVSAPSIDPIIQMQTQFDAFRAARLGVTDQIASQVSFRRLLPPSSQFEATMQIALLDFNGDPITGAPVVEVMSDPRDGGGLISAGPATPLGGGVYTVTIQSSDVAGPDRIAVRVVDGEFDRILMPSTPVLVQPRGDLNGNGVLSVADIGAFVLAITDRPAYSKQFPEVELDIVGDLSGDGSFGMEDIGAFVAALTDG